jgi:hypothetical protein
MSTPRPEQARIFPTIPRGEVIGRYEDYLDAQKIVDYLADNEFPVANVSIIGNDLKLVERVRTKLSYPRVALQGASQGAVIGLFFGLLLFLFTPGGESSGLSMIAAVLMGAVLFMLMSVINYAMQRGKRDFSSTRQVLPSTWDVVVDRTVAAQARQLASRLPMRPAQAATTSGWGAPTQAPPSQQPETGQQVPGGDGHDGQGVPGQQVAQPRTPVADFKDLADGRPRYGVRVDQGAQGTGRTPASAEQPGAPYQPSSPQVAGEFRPGADGDDPAEAGNASSGMGTPTADGPAQPNETQNEEPVPEDQSTGDQSTGGQDEREQR